MPDFRILRSFAALRRLRMTCLVERERPRPRFAALTISTMQARLRPFVEKIWNYHRLGHELLRSEAILVLCSHDAIVAERGAQLWLDRWAPLLIFSGGLGAVTSRFWEEPEADRFAKIAIGMGVSAEAILIENRSTNTGVTRRSGRCGRRRRSWSLHRSCRSTSPDSAGDPGRRVGSV